MVAPWRNTLAKSKQKHNAPSHNDNSKKMGVGVAWWHPEEMPWLSRSRSIMPLPTRTIQKKWGVWVAWWHNEEIPWLNRSRSIMLPSHNNDNSKKIECRGGMVAAWRNTLAKSKQKHNAPFPQQWQFQIYIYIYLGCRGGMVAHWRNTLDKSKHSKMGNWPLLFWGHFWGALFAPRPPHFFEFWAPGLSPWTDQTHPITTKVSSLLSPPPDIACNEGGSLNRRVQVLDLRSELVSSYFAPVDSISLEQF